MKEINIGLEIERLLEYALQEGLLKRLDTIVARNALLDLFEIAEPYNGDVEYQHRDSPQEILDKMLDYAAQKGILEENTITYRDLFDTKIMGLLMPRESEVAEEFWQTAKSSGIRAATKNYYHLAQASNYIRSDRVAKNMHWTSDTDYGQLEITINLSKPEKDPKAIAKAKEMKDSNYPQCFLCVNNIGYAGRLNHPARQNHRVIPLKLDGKEYFLQYSPYVYYNEHSIVFSAEHEPMSIGLNTFRRLLDFVDQIPHYFLGSNADLPLVGGSILSHDHFQGGSYSFAMEQAELEEEFNYSQFPEVEVAIVKWPMSVIRLRSENKERVIKLANIIYQQWQEYDDLERDIKSHSIVEGEELPHNTVTPIARKKETYFELDLVLRNNRTSKKYPEGIFHPHQELHHIKQENIGLIEVMGLAVLPGRLKEELKEIEAYLTGQRKYSQSSVKANQKLAKHGEWLDYLIDKYGNESSLEEARRILEEEVAIKFMRVLEDAGVYKRDEDGQRGFREFLNSIEID